MKGRKYSTEDIITAAFSVARREGWGKCSARTIAAELGSSTMPIYTALKCMKNLEDEIARRASDLLISYQTRSSSGMVFLDMGVGYVMFAQAERHLFTMMHYHQPDESDDSQRARSFRAYVFDALLPRLGEEPLMNGLSPQQREAVLKKMWIFSHGLAVLLNNAEIEPMSQTDITALLMETGYLIMTGVRANINAQPVQPPSDNKHILETETASKKQQKG